MSQPYIGEIRMFAGSFAPNGWLFCEGQSLQISEYETLFTLIGTTYGGDGQSTFALPDLRGRIPLHTSASFPLAQTGGVETVQLTVPQMPSHTHALIASANPAASNTPAGQLPALTQLATQTAYGTDAPLTILAPSSIGSIGSSQPHNNLQPYLCVSFIISLYGVFPPNT